MQRAGRKQLQVTVALTDELGRTFDVQADDL